MYVATFLYQKGTFLLHGAPLDTRIGEELHCKVHLQDITNSNLL